jgi:hypothetical protein
VDREEQLRVAELRQKNTLHVRLRLLQLLLIHQPKLLLPSHVAPPGRPGAALELVWDPLAEVLEAPLCPTCGTPSYSFELTRQGQLVCPACRARGTEAGRKPMR